MKKFYTRVLCFIFISAVLLVLIDYLSIHGNVSKACIEKLTKSEEYDQWSDGIEEIVPAIHSAQKDDETTKLIIGDSVCRQMINGLQEQNPGWLYEVNMGATTIWERWDSILPDGRFNPANMNSLNHYAYGSIGTWLYTKLAGLEILEPGYKKFSVHPRFFKGIEWVKLSYESVYGLIRTEWKCQDGKIRLEIEVPANTSAVLTLPEKEETIALGSGIHVYEYDTETSLHLDRYSMEMPLRLMMEHPVGKAMMNQYMPEMAENKLIEYVINEPITALLAYAPQAQPLYEMIIAAMNASEQ